MEHQINQTETLDDIVFEHRNRTYGAYELRKAYRNTLQKAFFTGTLLFVGLFSAPLIFAKLNPEKLENKRIVELDFTKFPDEPETPIEKPKAQEPPKPEEPIQTERFVPPVVVENQLPEETSPTQQELDDALIGTKKVDGEKPDGALVTPSDPPTAPPADPTTPAPVEETYMMVEQQPEFMGGMKALGEFLSKNLNYPSAAQRANVEGRVFVSFVVNKDGQIADAQLIKGVGFGCDEEALRVINKMPKWIAGKQNGKAVRVKFTLPIMFRLN